MRFLFVLLLFTVLHRAFSQTQVLPRDETQHYPSLNAFTNKLRKAVADRDTTALFPLLSENIMNGLGGEGGVEEFKVYWELNKPGTRLWTELEELLRLGATVTYTQDQREVNSATWPYIFMDTPDHFDAFDHLVMIKEGEPLRKQPEPDAEVIDTLSYQVLKWDYKATSKLMRERAYTWDNIAWYVVEYQDQVGYMSATALRSTIDYRMYALKSESGWKITILLAGD